MSGEQQKDFGDYLELEGFITAIQAGHPASLPQELTPIQAHVYRMALLFHAATSSASEPDAAFAKRLQILLERELET